MAHVCGYLALHVIHPLQCVCSTIIYLVIQASSISLNQFLHLYNPYIDGAGTPWKIRNYVWPKIGSFNYLVHYFEGKSYCWPQIAWEASWLCLNSLSLIQMPFSNLVDISTMWSYIHILHILVKYNLIMTYVLWSLSYYNSTLMWSL